MIGLPRLRSIARQNAGRRARPALDVLEERAVPSTLYVTTAVDPRGALVTGSLRWAVAQANRPGNAGSTIQITPLVQGAITLRAGELPIRAGLTIENASGAALTIQQGTPNSRIFHVLASAKSASVNLAGQGPGGVLTLTGGVAVNRNGGAILSDDPLASLNLSYVDVIGNAAVQVGAPKRALGGNGGGVYSQGPVILDHSSVSGNRAFGPNSASGQAGGVYADRGATLVASHVDGNAARDAAGLFNVTGNVFVLARSTVDGNSSSGDDFNTGDLGGGGIGQEIGYVTVDDSQVDGNLTRGMYSGGIVLLLGGTSVLGGSQVDGNTNTGPGGGIAANFEGPVIVSASQVDGNRAAGLGGGIVNFSERYGIILTNGAQVDGNVLTNLETGAVIKGLLTAASSPGYFSAGLGDPLLETALKQFAAAINARAAAITSAQDALPNDGNVVVGGGVAQALTGPITIVGGSRVIGNYAGLELVTPASPGLGGGVFANQGPITIDTSTIAGNTANDGDGGGIWNGESLVLTNSIVAGNVAGVDGGGGVFNRGTFTSTGSAIVNNTPDQVFPAS